MSSTIVTTAGGEPIALEAATVEALRSRLRGKLLQHGDDGYDGARRVWNGMIDRRPALISRCTGVADVIDSVNFARTHNLLVAVRGGGHNVAGMAVCDGGIMIDLSLMKGVHVHPTARTARVQPGVTLGELDREAGAFGLVAPAGIVSSTGVAGLTLGGGMGWLSRKHGLTCDNLLSVDVVTADGRFLTASAEENSDLFWGVRGGGGNFGIVTSFEYKLHPVAPMVVAGLLLHPMRKAGEFLRFLRDYAATIPDELTLMPQLRMAPPAPYLPEHLHGTPVVGTGVCYAGPIDEGERALRPLRQFGSPLLNLIGPRPYTEHQRMFDSITTPGSRYYLKSGYLNALGDDAIDAITNRAATIPSPRSLAVFFQLQGAVSGVGEDDTAYSHRDAAFALVIQAAWLDAEETERHTGWVRGFWKEVEPFCARGSYVNFISEDEGEERVRVVYGLVKYERLVALKNKYDPTNLFRLNQNIRPTV